MMQSGLSRELFESWCSDKKSGVIIAVMIVKYSYININKIYLLRFKNKRAIVSKEH